MSAENLQALPASASSSPASEARRLMRTALKGALATLDQRNGFPFASLVLVATDPDGSPLLFLSRLALHTQNIAKDPRASVLIDGTSGLGDPLTGGRVTITGHLRPTADANSKARFLARHASAQGYANFPDFAMYKLEVTGGHFIGGFGRIVSLNPGELLTDVASAGQLIAAEPSIVEHMNSDHADAVALYATELAGCEPRDWRMCGVDPAGADLLHRSTAARVEFRQPVRDAQEARVALIELVKQAREHRDRRAQN